jgi:hypothetical protein
MSDASLSDAITAIASHGTDAAFASFVQKFLDARVGLVAQNIPAGRLPGETFQTGPADSMTFEVVGTPDGRRMVKACADPPLFVRRYPETKINVLMAGRELLQMLAKVAELDGVLVCSATTFQSVPIDRAAAAAALAPRQAPARNPWWRLWR